MAESFGPYTCSQCGGRFEKAVSDDEARAEADAIFGDQEAQAIVCEDCFEKLVPLVSSVVVHREGAHEAVNVWVRGQLVGKLLVGEGQGEPLRTQLLAVVSLQSLLAEREGLRATLERVRAAWQGVADQGQESAQSMLGALRAIGRALIDGAVAEAYAPARQPDPYLAPELWTDEQRATIPRVVPAAGVPVRIATDAEQREALDQVLAGVTRTKRMGEGD